MSGQKNIDTFALNPETSISKFQERKKNGQPVFDISWTRDLFPNHSTTLDLRQLEALASRQPLDVDTKSLWESRIMTEAYKSGDISTKYDKYLHSNAGLRKALNALDQYGLAFITDVPQEEMAVQEIGERIGPLRHTFYGRTWDVKSKPNAENVAYTATELGLHMDLLYVKHMTLHGANVDLSAVT